MPAKNMKEYNKAYYEKNKEKLKEKVHCVYCNKDYAHWNYSKHLATAYHKKQRALSEDALKLMKTIIDGAENADKDLVKAYKKKIHELLEESESDQE